MKKLFISSVAILAMISSLSMAKTQGSSVGLNLIQSNYKTSVKSNNVAILDLEDDDVGVGLSYKYSINLGSLSSALNNFYIAPGAFIDFNNLDVVKEVNGVRVENEVKNSHGLTFDLGFDISQNFTLFLNALYLEARIDSASSTLGELPSQNQEGIGYGLGVKYKMGDKYYLALSYDEVELVDSFILSQGVIIDSNMSIDTIKLGLAYKF